MTLRFPEDMKKLFHVGHLDGTRKKPHVSLEGDGVSVSKSIEDVAAWRKIGRLDGDLWELTKKHPYFLRWSLPAQRTAERWCLKNDWLRPMKRFQVSWFDDEMGQEMFSLYDTREEAEDNADDVDVEEVESVALGPKGVAYWRKAFTSEPDNSLADALAIVWYAEAQNFDGVWWDEAFDPDRYSAPRGVIFQSKFPTWTKRRIDARGSL